MIPAASSPAAVAILEAIVAMGGLTLFMCIWMYATRIPAMNKQKINPQMAADPAFLKAALPADVKCVADNYNHLFEAPTIFYAIAIAIVLLGHADRLHAQCAWAYVVLRCLHSLVQASWNNVMTRFSLFILSWVVLAVMIVRECLHYELSAATLHFTFGL